MQTEKKLEAILFWKGEPMSRKKLGDILKVEQSEINNGIESLKSSLQDRGVALIENGDDVMLGTTAELSSLIEDLQKEELNKDLSKAALETLSIVLYKNGVSRTEIDYIRGVNSSFTLRALSVRGLIDKTADLRDSRRFVYKPSLELLSYIGVKSVQELPEYDTIHKEIEVATVADAKNENSQ